MANPVWRTRGFHRWGRAKTRELMPDLDSQIEACGFPIKVHPRIDYGPEAIVLFFGTSMRFNDALDRAETLFSLLESILDGMADLPLLQARRVLMATGDDDKADGGEFVCWQARERWPERDGYSAPRFGIEWPDRKTRT